MKVTRSTNPADCVTLADRMAYSEMIKEWWAEIAEDFCAITRFNEVPEPSMDMPWTSGDWAEAQTKSQRLKQALEAREARRAKNRALYATPPKDDEI
jgi:hypothetical protein